MKETRARDRLVALFLFGCFAMNPPLLAVFRTEVLVAGVPLLFLYLFAVWAVLIALLVLIIERGSRVERERAAPDPALPES
jgi:hypothetical protein